MRWWRCHQGCAHTARSPICSGRPREGVDVYAAVEDGAILLCGRTWNAGSARTCARACARACAHEQASCTHCAAAALFFAHCSCSARLLSGRGPFLWAFHLRPHCRTAPSSSASKRYSPAFNFFLQKVRCGGRARICLNSKSINDSVVSPIQTSSWIAFLATNVFVTLAMGLRVATGRWSPRAAHSGGGPEPS